MSEVGYPTSDIGLKRSDKIVQKYLLLCKGQN